MDKTQWMTRKCIGTSENSELWGLFPMDDAWTVVQSGPTAAIEATLLRLNAAQEVSA